MIFFFLSFFFLQGIRGFMGHELPGKQFMTPHVLHELFCYCQRKSMSFIVSAIDPELMSHGPLLVFHTPESSHDPVLAAEAGPRPPGSAILFHTEYTDLKLAWKKIHAFVYSPPKRDIGGTHSPKWPPCHTFPKHTHTYTHMDTHTFLAHMHIHCIPRNPQRGKDGLTRGGRGEKSGVYCIRAIHTLQPLRGGLQAVGGVGGGGGVPLCMALEAPPTCKYFGHAGILCTFPTGGETFSKHKNFC